jgi:hypothetical protein
MLGAIDDDVMAGFVARLESLNELADTSAGFVWRYQTDAGDATEVRVFDDEMILFNMSVWESIEALEEAKERFDILWRDGPGTAAFSFKERFLPSAE